MKYLRLDTKQGIPTQLFVRDVWSDRFQQEREQPAATRAAGTQAAGPQSAATREQLHNLRAEYTALVGRTKHALQHPWLMSPACEALQILGRQAVDASKMVYGELRRCEQDTHQEAPIGALAGLLAIDKYLVECLEKQLALIDNTTEHAACLQETTSKLVVGRRTSAAGLHNLARRIVHQVHHADSVFDMLPIGGFSHREPVPGTSSHDLHWVSARGVTAARLTALAVENLPLWANRSETMTGAALLLDIAYLLPKLRSVKRDESAAVRASVARNQHPQIGAALVAGLNHTGCELPQWIAQHHERLDGTGYPRGLRAPQLRPSSRLLAVVHRFLELLEREAAKPSLQREPTDLTVVFGPAARALLAEAEHGEIDRDFTNALLQAVNARLEHEIEGRRSSATAAADQTLRSLGYRRDLAHAGSVPAAKSKTSRLPADAESARQTADGQQT